MAARERQLARLTPFGLRCNAEMTAKVLRETCPLDAECEAYLKLLVEERRSMSARSIDRLIKVARSIADLLGQDCIDRRALREAADYRAVDPTTDIFLAPPPLGAKRRIGFVRISDHETATVIVDQPEDEATVESPTPDERPSPTPDERPSPTPDELARASEALPILPSPP